MVEAFRNPNFVYLTQEEGEGTQFRFWFTLALQVQTLTFLRFFEGGRGTLVKGPTQRG
jgi:hypothetical protein